jgi:hypothetical protein
MQAEDQRTKQIRLLDECSKLIDIGTKKRKKIAVEFQTDISMNALSPFQFSHGAYIPENYK